MNILKVLGRQKPLAQLKLLRRGTKNLQSYSYARMTAQIEIEVCSCIAWKTCHGFSSVRLFVVQNRAHCPPFVHSWKSTTWGVILRFVILHVFLHFYGLWTNSDNEVLLSNVGNWERNNFQRIQWGHNGNMRLMRGGFQRFHLKLANLNFTRLQ